MNELKQIEEKRSNEIEIDLVELFHQCLERLWIIILCCVIGAGLAFGYTKLIVTPQYTSTSMIYILTKTTSVTSLADIQMGSQLTVDFELLAKSRPVLEEVIEKLELDTTYEELKEQIVTENPSNTRILYLNAIDPSPKQAKEIANALADSTADRIADIMKTDKPTIAERAIASDNPSSPSTVKNTAIGGLVALFLALAVIVVRFLMNDTIQTEEDIRKYLNLNTLAAIPLEKGK